MDRKILWNIRKLKDKSRRPKSHPNKHTEEEIKLIRKYKTNNKKTGLVVLWIKLRDAGYRRNITSLYRMLIKLKIYNKVPIKKKEKNSGYYPEMTYPGEKVQTDNGFEFTHRLSWQAFMKEKKTMFKNKLEKLRIEYKVIRPHTPKENGKVERSHRKDQERFYYDKVFCSLKDLKNRAKYWIREYNNFPIRPLGWLSPRQKLE